MFHALCFAIISVPCPVLKYIWCQLIYFCIYWVSSHILRIFRLWSIGKLFLLILEKCNSVFTHLHRRAFQCETTVTYVHDVFTAQYYLWAVVQSRDSPCQKVRKSKGTCRVTSRLPGVSAWVFTDLQVCPSLFHRGDSHPRCASGSGTAICSYYRSHSSWSPVQLFIHSHTISAL